MKNSRRKHSKLSNRIHLLISFPILIMNLLISSTSFSLGISELIETQERRIQSETIVQADIEAEAQKLFKEGFELFRQGTAESLRKAIERWEKAIPLSFQVENKLLQAGIILLTGNTYNDLGEKKKALDYYNQALPLYQAVGDRNAEATTLNNIGYVCDA